MNRLPTPFHEADGITLYHGDAREIAPLLGPCDAVFADPPYGETALEWDVWPDQWPKLAIPLAPQMWCFGSMRMFFEHLAEFADWKLAQDIVWEKHNGSSMRADRFRRVHEFALHFYRGEWSALHHATPREPGTPRRGHISKRIAQPTHWNAISDGHYEYGDTRLMRSVISARSCHRNATNETQKPVGLVAPLLEYSVPRGGSVVDLFAGSGTVLEVARAQGKRAIGIELRREQCEAVVERIRQREFAL